ncbi:MAG: BBP7 family outer membrane beta-barrel protein [Gemmataceae bacterium]|nr:BBP7 family outer membrane beta-barrel protein [Gemmataceae bacterium]
MRIRTLLAMIGLTLGAGTALSQEPTLPVMAPVPTASEAFAAPPSESGARFLAEVDYIIYWLKPVCLKPPTLTTGNLSDPQPGVPGQPGTQLVQGDHKFEFKGANGIRPRLAAWMGEDQWFGLEVEGFVLEQVAASQNVGTTNGSPATFILFQDPQNVNTVLPLTIPGVVTGNSTAYGTTQMWGVESNLAFRWPTEHGSKLHATLLAGVRYLHLDDQVEVTNRQALVANPSAVTEGTASFTTRNQFIGGQIGSRFGIAGEHVAFDVTTKVAVGETYLVSEVAGGPLLSGASVLPPLTPGPVLALASNVGRQSSYRISVVPELNLKLRWMLSQQTQVSLGYNVLYWNKVLCPGDQMDTHANPTLLPFRGPATGPAVPAKLFSFTDAFAQGLELGLGFSF